MLDGVKGFADVDCDRSSAERRFNFIESNSDTSGCGKEGSGGRVRGAEAMLGRGGRERGGEEGEEEPFKDLRGRAEKGDRAVRGGV